MTSVEDAPRFQRGLERLARLERMTLDADALRDWWTQFERYPIDVVLKAFAEAPGEKGRTQAWAVTASLVDGLCRKHAAAMAHSRQTRYVAHGEAVIAAPGRRIDGQAVAVVEAEYRCPRCCDSGWVARVTETGEVLTAPALQAEANMHPSDGARLSGTAYRMRRCGCRTGGR
jgi:hypothetical protein